jgi:hypothetical protein
LLLSSGRSRLPRGRAPAARAISSVRQSSASPRRNSHSAASKSQSGVAPQVRSSAVRRFRYLGLIQDVRGNRSRQRYKFGGLRHQSSSANAIVAPLAKRRLPRFMRPSAHSKRVPWLRVPSASRVAYLQAKPPAAGIGHGCGDFRMMWSDAARRPSFNRALANGRESTSPMLKYSWRPGPPLARSLFSVAEGDV